MAQEVKKLPARQETWVRSLGWEDPLEEKTANRPVFLPEESHGQRNLAGYSPWGLKESDMTEVTKHTSLFSHAKHKEVGCFCSYRSSF